MDEHGLTRTDTDGVGGGEDRDEHGLTRTGWREERRGRSRDGMVREWGISPSSPDAVLKSAVA
jgi:hypothetical protein